MAEDPTSAELTLLLEVQATDHALRKLQHRLDELPEQRQLDEAIARRDQLAATLADVEARLAEAEAEAETIDADVTTLARQRDAEQVRLYDGTVTNQREMSSVEAEIASTEARITEHEEDLLTVLERVEELEARRDALRGEVAETTASVAAAEAARDAAAKELLAEIGESQAVRDRQAAGLPDDLLARYEAAAERGGGTGVGALDQGSCTACRIDMSMVDLDELHSGPALATCPECRRLLVVRT